MQPQDAHTRTQRELQAERAEALSRIARALEALIAEVAALRDQLPTINQADRAAFLERFRMVRENARRYRWYLEVQREALGLRQHRMLDELYRIPGMLEEPATEPGKA